MHTIPPHMVGLYDYTGRHLGGVYDPLMVDGQLTLAHAACLAGRPANRLIWSPSKCTEPERWFSLVFMAPSGQNPLTIAPMATAYLVQALDAGTSVQIHAETEDAIDAVCSYVNPWLGGGHA